MDKYFLPILSERGEKMTITNDVNEIGWYEDSFVNNDIVTLLQLPGEELFKFIFMNLLKFDKQ